MFSAAFAAFFVAWFVSLWIGKNSINQTNEKQKSDKSLKEKIILSFKSGFGDILQHTAPWILLGLFIASVIEPFLQDGFLSKIGSTWDVILFAILGIPIYVCATGATPFVAILIAKGISPGAAIAFLLTGPATNLTTFGIITQMYGRKIAVLFSISMIGIAICLGYLTNPLLTNITVLNVNNTHESVNFIGYVSLFVLGCVYFYVFISSGPRKFFGEMSPK